VPVGVSFGCVRKKEDEEKEMTDSSRPGGAYEGRL